jgi:glycosyltransferase involved in cell wall biosynthesis
MKILFLNHNIKGRGTFIRCLHFAKYLVQFGHSVVILTSAPHYILFPEKEIIDGVEVLCMPDVLGKRARNGGLGPIDTLMRCLYLMGRRFDILENFDHRPAALYPALVGKYLRGMPLISEWTDLHGTGGSLSNRPGYVQKLIRPYEDFTERKSKKLPSKLVVISSGLREHALRLGIPDSKIVWIPGGADVDNICPKPKEEARRDFKLPLNEKVIAYTAGTHYDADLFIKTICEVQKARQDVLLITTGAIIPEEQRRRLINPEKIVEFGFLPYEKYAALLPAADLFVFPFSNCTLNTGRWPNKIGDYMAAGRPTVSNSTGDMVALFEKHQIGLLSEDVPEKFAGRILDILTNEELAENLGYNARLAAEKYYDWSLLTKRLESCFVEVIEEKRGH